MSRLDEILREHEASTQVDAYGTFSYEAPRTVKYIGQADSAGKSRQKANAITTGKITGPSATVTPAARRAAAQPTVTVPAREGTQGWITAQGREAAPAGVFDALPGGVDVFSQTMDFLEQRRQEQEQERQKENAGFFSRLWDTIQGAGKSFAGSLVNAAGSLQDVTYGQTSEMLQGDFTQKANAAAEDVRQKEAALQALSGQEGTDAYADAERELEHAKNELALLQSQVDFFADDARGIQGTYSIADTLSGSANEDLERAKAGLGTLGQFAVDAGAGLAQLGGDLAIGALTGGSALPAMAVRSYGGAAQEARLSGADARTASLYGLGSGAVSLLTEKISNAAAPLARAFGRGVADDAIETGVRQALDSLATSETGRAALQRLGTVLLSAGGEGVEEALESAVSPILQRLTYDPDATWDWSEIARDGLLGAAIGGVLGGVGGSANESAAYRNTQQTPSVQQSTGVQPEVQQTQQSQTQQAPQNNTASTGRAVVANTSSQVEDIEIEPSTRASSPNDSAVQSVNIDGSDISIPEATRYVNTQASPVYLKEGAPSEVIANELTNTPTPEATEPAPSIRGTTRNQELFLPAQQTSSTTSETNLDFLDDSFSDTTIPQAGTGVNTEHAHGQQKNTAPPNLTPQEAPAPTAGTPDMGTGTQRADTASTPEGMGAASLGFDPYSNLQNQTDRFIPPGENPARVVDVTAQDAQGRNISRTVRTAMEAKATPDAAVPTIEQAVADGLFSYDPVTNADTLAQAEARIQQDGFTESYRQWQANLNQLLGADQTAMGWALYNRAANSGDTQTALSILTDIVGHTRKAAQALQATRILKQMSPAAQLQAAEVVRARLQSQMERRLSGSGQEIPSLTIDEELARQFLEAETQEQRDAILQDIYRDLGRQMPATFADKFNAWRYLAMLGNPRTHIRNIVGNAAFVPVRAVRDLMSSGAQRLILGKTGEGSQRTRTILNPGSAQDRARLDYAMRDFGQMQDQIMGENRYTGDGANAYVQEGRQIFGRPLEEDGGIRNRAANVLETVSRGNTELLDREDVWFSKPAYALSLASFMKARGLTPENITPAQLNEARAHATEDAQRATYRDRNAFSNFISGIRVRNPQNGIERAAGALIEGVLPFRRTPANIAVRAVEYSPAGLIRGIKQAAVDVRQGRMDAATAIDNITQGLTGSAILGLGAFLASQGLLSAGPSGDDKEDAQEKLTGGQDYALNIGGKSYTLDWMAPMAIPLFVGAQLYENLQSQGASVWDVLSSSGAALEPMLEMSMLQSLNELFESGRYSDMNALIRTAATTATSYFTQAIPTLAGQVARTIDPLRRTNTTDTASNIPDWLQYPMQQTAGKLPGLASTREPYVDAWGRTDSEESAAMRFIENFVSPGYISEDRETAADREVQRLYDLGFTGALPAKDDKTFSAGGEEITMTPEEYTQHSILQGQTAYEMVSALIESDAYQGMSDADKDKAIRSCYDFASQIARQDTAAGRGLAYEVDGNVERAMEAQDAGISLGDWFSAKFQHDAIENNAGDGTKKGQMVAEFADWLEQQDFTPEQQALLREQMRYWNMVPAEAEKYDNMVAAGIPSSQALEVFDAISALSPENGADSVSRPQQFRAIADLPGLTAAQTYDVLEVYQGRSAGSRDQVQAAEGMGFHPDAYVRWYEIFKTEEAEKGGTLSGAEVQEILNSSRALNQEQKSMLFVLFAPSSTKRNPYGGVGPKNYDWPYVQ